MKPWVYEDVFIWNLDFSVGKGAANSLPADVSYIQWYYTLAAEHPETPEDRKAIYRKVRVTGHCNGTDDDPLVAAIFAQQRAVNHPFIDGKIDVANAIGKVGSGKAFFIFRLGARLATMFPAYWPRLELIPRCPPLVRAASLAAIPKVLPQN